MGTTFNPHWLANANSLSSFFFFFNCTALAKGHHIKSTTGQVSYFAPKKHSQTIINCEIPNILLLKQYTWAVKIKVDFLSICEPLSFVDILCGNLRITYKSRNALKFLRQQQRTQFSNVQSKIYFWYLLYTTKAFQVWKWKRFVWNCTTCMQSTMQHHRCTTLKRTRTHPLWLTQVPHINFSSF